VPGCLETEAELGLPWTGEGARPTRVDQQPARISAMPKPSATARARKIKLIIFDVDGVLTDGKIWIFPAPGGSQAGSQQSVLERSAQHGGQGGFGLHSTSLIEAKGFHAHDGTGISLARMAGIKTGIITKRISETVALRARDLKIDHVFQGIQDKASVFAQILQKDGIMAAEAAFVGDDVIDLPAMRKCGLAIAVKNARPEVEAEAHWVTPHAGGDGAARDAVEYILKAQGKWKQAVEDYISERS
jgi:3-deoxy-D-manno-octulosonate 8-phosphate phosphatase (KDO 8-P phosphatase)